VQEKPKLSISVYQSVPNIKVCDFFIHLFYFTLKQVNLEMCPHWLVPVN